MHKYGDRMRSVFIKFFDRYPNLITRIPESAVARYYWLLDSGELARNGDEFPAGLATTRVAAEYGVSTEELWRWIRDRASNQPPTKLPEKQCSIVQ